MSTSPLDPAVLPALRDQAADWHVRLASDVASEGDWLEFERWLAVAPEHLRAFEAVEALWLELDAAEPGRERPIAGAPRRPRLPARSRVWLPIAAAAALVLAVGVAVRPLGPRTQVYETARGERQTVRLADGSQLTLNGATRIRVRLGRRERDVELARGEAVFDVAKDASRPFVIALGDRQVRVVGTEFDILRHERAVVVTVRRGVVEVRPGAAAAGGKVSRISAGWRLAHREGERADIVGPADPDAAFAWTQGRLIFREARLADVVQVLNRYVQTPLVVDDDAQSIPVTAVIALDQEDVMVRQLTEFLPIEARRQGGELRLARR